jgi:hypothetical protein
MQIHFAGHIISTDEYIGRGSKRPAKKPITVTSRSTPDAKVGAQGCNAKSYKESSDGLNFFVSMSFSSRNGYKTYLEWLERKIFEGSGLLEGMVESHQLYLPPKDQPSAIVGGSTAIPTSRTARTGLDENKQIPHWNHVHCILRSRL